ncbi:MAG: hypothetical protein IJ877_00715 [Candidatus Gastranaerophilales bacterium]|nr:hypothetical protein [Candidatus Gastranaerophilales bacterium]
MKKILFLFLAFITATAVMVYAASDYYDDDFNNNHNSYRGGYGSYGGDGEEVTFQLRIPPELTGRIDDSFFQDRTEDFYRSMPDDGVKFYTKIRTCTPAKFASSKEAVYGKTKDGRCHYSFKFLKEGKDVENHCFLPMSVAVGYSTTALDVREYAETNSELSSQRIKQNNEIRKIMYDYCKLNIK